MEKEYCRVCKNKNTAPVYFVENTPIFQNKIYKNKQTARKAVTSTLSLYCCKCCGHVFNSTFDHALMDYDTTYHNEQTYSLFFKNYLETIIALFKQHGFQDHKIVEIGCGKGHFLELLQQHDFDVVGFDPAYDGNNPAIIKDYFGDQYSNIDADIVVLRHVLEHIEYPVEFLNKIVNAVNPNAKIFIEVPCLEWIVKNMAFWDIFHEHCNYFSQESLQNLFRESILGHLFNDQYMYLLADLKNLNTHLQNHRSNGQIGIKLKNIDQKINSFKELVSKNPGMLVWGAGAKGVTFVNLVDPNAEFISYLVDINPEKQNRFISKTGHEIIAPEQISSAANNKIIIMNDNYVPEIKKSIPNGQFDLLSLKDLST